MKNNVIKLHKSDNEALRKAREKEQKQQDYLEAADQWLNEKPTHFCAVQGRYLMKVDSEWKFIKPESMKPYCPVWNAVFAAAFREQQSERGWLHADITYSFRKDIHPDIFNLMDTSGWVQPASGDHHWIFDVLMRSLGSGKTENIVHIERIILHKYLHPECYLLPCLVIHGEGGVGKNLLVDKVLHTMFDGQTVSATSDNITGQFNSLAKGRTVVMINESVSDRADTATLKDMLQKVQNSVQTFPDSGGKQRPIVSTLVRAILRRLRGRVWGVLHGYDCRNPPPSLGQQGEHQLDRA